MMRMGWGLMGLLWVVSGWATPALGLTVIDRGEAFAAIVTADDPSDVAARAAEELAWHLQQATGVWLPILPESQWAGQKPHALYVGATRAAERQGLRLQELAADTFVLRRIGSDLFVAGDEGDGSLPPPHNGAPWVPSDAPVAHRGTLYGVYELLDRYVQVRWLWPGELGTHIPRQERIQLPAALDDVAAPAFTFRRFRWNLIAREARPPYDARFGRLAFSEAGIAAYHDDLQAFVRRHRLGDTTAKPPIEHSFAGWWDRLGEQHPEWFMMHEDGHRGPPPAGWTVRPDHVPMCVSNPQLHRYIVDEDWDGASILRLGEVDRRAFCHCPTCLAWDEPLPDVTPAFAPNLYRPMVSNRYARFWQTIRDMALARNPDAIVTTFLYWNYLPAPEPIVLGPQVYGEFVPWGQSEITFFPLQADAYQWLIDQWDRWVQTGMTLAYRPNYFNGGYVMPHLSTWQAGEFIRRLYQQGMVGFDFDSLVGNWATQGPMLYMHLRLGTKPWLPIETIRAEYFAAFGPAAAAVEAYFDYWETYARDRPGGPLYSNLFDAHLAYPEPALARGFALLAEAAAQVQAEPASLPARRVAFLEAGLQHAAHSAHLMGLLERGKLPADAKRRAAATAALRELIAFRRAHEHLYIADYVSAARREHRWLEIDAMLGEATP